MAKDWPKTGQKCVRVMRIPIGSQLYRVGGNGPVGEASQECICSQGVMAMACLGCMQELYSLWGPACPCD